MDIDSKVLLALRNNVHWYDVLCELHGVPGEHHPAYWINHGRVPPYMSNFITLAGGAHAEAQLAAIQSMIKVDQRAPFGVKDAFQCLDLAPLGFHILFEATWIYRAAHAPISEVESERVEWSLARTPAELETWERTWRGTGANANARAHSPIFRPGLLQNPDFSFLLGNCGGATVATAALNRTNTVVGISNVFSGVLGAAPLFPGCVRMARSLHPDLPLVGYERGPDLVAAIAAGFEPLRGLRVWKRTPS